MCKEYVLYDNTNLYDDRDEIRTELFQEYAEEQDWITESNVPDKMIDDEIQLRDEICWSDLKYSLERMFKNGHYLLTGTCGRWNGNYDGGKFIETVSDLLTCIQHLDYITFTDRDGHLLIDGYHHDGRDHYELKKLTNKGYELASNNYFANDRQLHNTIMNNNFYSCLPRLATI